MVRPEKSSQSQLSSGSGSEMAARPILLALVGLLLPAPTVARLCRGTDMEAQGRPGAPTVPRSCKILDLSHSGLCHWWERTAAGKAAAACEHGAALGDLATVLLDESVHHAALRELRLDHNGLSASDAGGFVVALARSAKPPAGGAARPTAAAAGGRRQQQQGGQLPPLTRAKPSTPTVSLSNNHLGNEGARAIAEVLGRGAAGTAGCVLWPPTKLDLTHNGIGDAGAMALADALEASPAPALQELVLWHNDIGEAGARALARGLLAPTSKLRALRLWSNAVGDGGAAALAEAVRRGGSLAALRTLDLADNGVGDAGAKALAAALGQEGGAGCALNALELNSNQIGEAGLAALAAQLGTNHRLRKLGLEHNPAAGANKSPFFFTIRTLIKRNADAYLEALLEKTKQEL